MSHRFHVGLIGSGIGGSLTPALHMAEAREHGLDYDYRVLDLDRLPGAGGRPEPIGVLVRAARSLGFDGLNITHPAKQAVIAELDGLSDEARAIGAVNTVVFDAGRSIGHNTDAAGFAELARRALDGERADLVVQFGAGGAGAAVAHALLGGPVPVGRVEIVDVDAGRAAALAARLGARFGTERAGGHGAGGIRSLLGRADGLVNATPMGMAAHPGSPVEADAVDERHWVIDVVYLPLETRLMRDAAARGARVTGGIGMTAFQAAGAFRLFTGVEPDGGRMLAHAERLARGAA